MEIRDEEAINQLLDHAHVSVTVRPALAGEVPVLTVAAPLGVTPVIAMSLASMREAARLARAEPAIRPLLREYFEALVGQFERECDQKP